jgi:diacylglycerol kinase family enzyme
MQDRPFVNVASTGLSPAAAAKAHGLKRAVGALAYAIGALHAGLTAKPVRCRVDCDGQRLFDGRAWQAMVAVTGVFGGGAAVDADPHDGELDVVVIEATSSSGWCSTPTACAREVSGRSAEYAAGGDVRSSSALTAGRGSTSTASWSGSMQPDSEWPRRRSAWYRDELRREL